MICRDALVGVALAMLIAACAAPPPAVRIARVEPLPHAVWISGVAVLDVARGERIPDRDVLIANGRIVAIEPAGTSAPPTGALVISGSDATLVPGLVDMHGHVFASPAPPWRATLPDPEAVMRSYLYCGVTTVFDPGDPTDEAFARRDRQASGELMGPRIFAAGPLLTAPDGHPIATMRALAPAWIAWWLAPQQAVTVDSVEEADTVVDEIADHGADAVKIVIDAIPLDAPRMKPEIAHAIVERARSRGLRTVAHIGTTEDAIEAGDAGVALWVHGVYKERIPDEKISVLASYRIPMVATIEVFDSYARVYSGPRIATSLERETAPAELLDSFDPVPADFDIGKLQSWTEVNAAAGPARIENVRRLHEAGVTILAGSDSQPGVFPGPGLHRELANLVRAGFTPTEAIRAATLDPARFLAQSDAPGWGNVAVGQRADLLLVEGDPTGDIAALGAIRVLLQAGVPIERAPVVNPER